MKKLLSLFFVLVLCLAFVDPVVAQTKQIDLTFDWQQTIPADFYGWKMWYSATSGGPYTQLGSDILYTPPPTSAYTSDEMVVAPDNAETTFYFVVNAWDTDDNNSADSNEVSYTADFLAPGTPVQLNVTITTP